MKKFTIEIRTVNAAFEYDEAGEITRILKTIIEDANCGCLKECYNDENGNQVCYITTE